MSIHNSVLELIGDTPIVKAQRLDCGKCELFLKLENSNPGGSIKDRIGLSMIESAERAGKIKPGDTLVEGTAGNTGIGLALVAQQKGYRLVLVVPDKMSREKIFNLKAMGAEVVLTRSDVAKGHPQYYQDMAERLARETPGAYFINQFGNPDNPRAHEESTGPGNLAPDGRQARRHRVRLRIVRHDDRPVALFRAAAPNVELVLADPVGTSSRNTSTRARYRRSPRSWMVEGIGEDFLPSISDFSRVKKAYAITDKESFLAGRELLEEGRHPRRIVDRHAARRRAEILQASRRRRSACSLFVCDTGNKYLSKMYNDYWMLDNGFLEREHYGDLRDLILRPYSQRDTVVVGPAEPLITAYQRMKLYDVSQLPVMDGDKIVGIVDESDVLIHVYGDESKFRDPVSTAMVSQLQVLDVKSPIESLLPMFDAGHVAIVMDGEQFLGLITRIDLLNYLCGRYAFRYYERPSQS